jgi:hypothetical protein
MTAVLNRPSTIATVAQWKAIMTPSKEVRWGFDAIDAPPMPVSRVLEASIVAFLLNAVGWD